MSRALPPVDRFCPLAELVEMRVFGKKSLWWLRYVASMQTKDPRKYKGKLKASWQLIASYPRFVQEGNTYGLYLRQVAEYQARKMGLR